MNILRRAGLDDLADRLGEPAGPPPWESDPFDAVAMRREQARRYLQAHRLAARYGTPAVDPVTRETVLVPPSIDRPLAAEWVRQVLGDANKVPFLLVVGPTGAGKSRLCWAVVAALKLGRAEQERGLNCWMVGHADFNAHCRPTHDEGHVEAYERYANADLLVLDDLAATRSTEWTEENLYRLVDHRWVEKLPTVFATNHQTRRTRQAGEDRDRNDLERVLGDRVASRVMDAVIVAVIGDDRRLTDAQGRQEGARP